MALVRIAVLVVAVSAVSCHSAAQSHPLATVDAGAADPRFARQVTDSAVIAKLESAPLSVLVQGQRLSLWAGLSRDFMPLAPVNGHPLAAVLRIASADSAVLVTTLRVDTTWVLSGGEAWALHHASREVPSDTARVYEVSMFGGPKWPPGIRVDVVVRIQDKAGRIYFLRATGVKVMRTA